MRCITNNCVSREACDVVVCVDSLSSFQGSVNLHWTSRLDDLKPDGRERSENTVHLTETTYCVWSTTRPCPNPNRNPGGPPGKRSSLSTRSPRGGLPHGRSPTHWCLMRRCGASCTLACGCPGGWRFRWRCWQEGFWFGCSSS